MVSMTKNNRYSSDVVRALMENYHELEASLTESDPTHMYPMYDYYNAVQGVDFTPMERKVFDTRFPMDEMCPSSFEAAKSLEVSKQYVGQTANTITNKITAEMNRGVTDV